eukprot:EC690253.1.p5 GENE.EC690253.1~~EC690253.1.p5  ORF type:complete len:62 (-),score=13.54 EC690253.1:146-331(-)
MHTHTQYSTGHRQNTQREGQRGGHKGTHAQGGEQNETHDTKTHTTENKNTPGRTHSQKKTL